MHSACHTDDSQNGLELHDDNNEVIRVWMMSSLERLEDEDFWKTAGVVPHFKSQDLRPSQSSSAHQHPVIPTTTTKALVYTTAD